MKNLRLNPLNFCIGLFGAACLIIIASCNFGPPENSRAVQARKGMAHFMDNCAICHGEDGKGLRIDSLDLFTPDLTRITKRRRVNEFPVMTVAKIIDGRTMMKGHGTREMPIWGRVYSDVYAMDETEIKGQLGELVAFLINIQGN